MAGLGFGVTNTRQAEISGWAPQSLRGLTALTVAEISMVSLLAVKPGYPGTVLHELVAKFRGEAREVGGTQGGAAGAWTFDHIGKAHAVRLEEQANCVGSRRHARWRQPRRRQRRPEAVARIGKIKSRRDGTQRRIETDGKHL